MNNRKRSNDEEYSYSDHYDQSGESYSDSSDNESSDESSDEFDPDVDSESDDGFTWRDITRTFSPRMTLPEYKEPETLVDSECSIEQVFLKLFPKSFFIWVSDCTNERLKILSEEKNRNVKMTNPDEIMVVIGCLLVMSYNRVPHMWMYWSKNKSLRNETIASAISRDRFMLLHSKLYFNHPKRPENADKTYYINEMVNCLLTTFNRYRTEATFQSIDEFMVKFEGRTTMKQYQPLKPVQVGVKGFGRADAMSGYMYDFYIYKGRNDETKNKEGTAGERVCFTRRLITLICQYLLRNDLVRRL